MKQKVAQCKLPCLLSQLKVSRNRQVTGSPRWFASAMESVSLPSIVLSPPNSRLQIGFKHISNCTVVKLRKETVLACKTIWRCGVYCKCCSHSILEHFFVITMIPLCSSMSMTCWSAKRILRILHSVKVLVVLNRLVDNAFFTSVRDDTSLAVQI